MVESGWRPDEGIEASSWEATEREQHVEWLNRVGREIEAEARVAFEQVDRYSEAHILIPELVRGFGERLQGRRERFPGKTDWVLSADSNYDRFMLLLAMLVERGGEWDAHKRQSFRRMLYTFGQQVQHDLPEENQRIMVSSLVGEVDVEAKFGSLSAAETEVVARLQESLSEWQDVNETDPPALLHA